MFKTYDFQMDKSDFSIKNAFSFVWIFWGIERQRVREKTFAIHPSIDFNCSILKMYVCLLSKSTKTKKET